MLKLGFTFAMMLSAAGVIVPASARAVTPAGTLISNTATVSFSNGPIRSTEQTNTVSVRVDEVLNVTVTPLSTTPVTSLGGPATLVYQVTNNGNGNEPFNLAANANVVGNAFNGTIQALAIDVNGDGVYEPGTDTIVANGNATPALTPDSSVKVLVLVDLPANVSDAQASKVQLAAASPVGTGAPGTLFAGKGNGGVDAIVGATGAQGMALGSLIAKVAAISITKSASVVDPYGTSNAISGAIVTYSLIVHVAGSGTASGLVVIDNFPAGTAYVPGSVTLGGVALTDATGATASGIRVSLGDVPAGSPDMTVTFKVKLI